MAFKAVIRDSNHGISSMDNHPEDDDSAFIKFAESIPLDTVVFSASDLQLLELYDELQELRLEHALLDAQNTVAIATDEAFSVEDAESEIKTLERECLETRSTYLLRESIVKNVILADPTLKAVHSGSNANPTERHLHPLLDQRDTLSIALTNLSSSLHSALNDLSTTELHNITCIATNRELTRTLLDLAGKLKTQNINEIDDPELRTQLENLREDIKESTARWRIIKSVLAAIIAGSGIDWARDDSLRDLVLDDED